MARKILVLKVKDNEDNGKTIYVQTDDGDFLAAPYTDIIQEAVQQWGNEDITDAELLDMLDNYIEATAGVVQKKITTKLERVSERIHTDGMHLYIDGDTFSNVEIDKTLEDHLIRLITTKDNSEYDKRNWESFVAFTENLYNNVDPDIRSQIFSWLSAQNWLTFTEDGCIIGYKGCQINSESGVAESINQGPGIVNDEIYNGHLPNPDGAVVEIAKKLVTKDPASGCASGLHVGTYDYAYDFARGIILKVKVNPRDIVSVPYDCEAQKIRCCRYVVLEHELVNQYSTHDDEDYYAFDTDELSYGDDNDCDDWDDDWNEDDWNDDWNDDDWNGDYDDYSDSWNEDAHVSEDENVADNESNLNANIDSDDIETDSDEQTSDLTSRVEYMKMLFDQIGDAETIEEILNLGDTATNDNKDCDSDEVLRTTESDRKGPVTIPIN